MAGFGLNYPCFKPDGAANGAVLGKAVTANLTVNLASGELYADDGLAEQLSEFTSGSLALETDDLSDANAALLYGATVAGGVVTYKKDDTAPMGCLAYYKTMMKNGVKTFRGYFYPKVRAALGNDNATTKGSSITFQTTSTAITVFATDDDGTWRETETFTSAVDAAAWVKDKCGINTAPSARLTILNLGSLTLTPTFDSGVFSYTAATTNATNTINVTAEDSSAVIDITVDSNPVTNGSAVTWNTGSNIVEITVTNGTATQTYTVNVTKS